MPFVKTIVPAFEQGSGRMKMTIKGSNGDSFVVPWAPRNIEHSGLHENVVEIERPGRVAEIVVSSPALHKMSFSFTLGANIWQSCELELLRLENIAAAGGWIMILYGLRETGIWKLTSMTYASIEREPTKNMISRAEVSMEFTEVPDSRKVVAKYSEAFNFRDDKETYNLNHELVIAMQQANVAMARQDLANRTGGIPSSGNDWGETYPGVVTPPSTGAGETMWNVPGYPGGNAAPQGPTTVQTPNPAPMQEYVVQAGDTLLGIARKFYGDHAEQFWRLLGDANRVTFEPLIGQILRVP